ncbi:MAG: AMP-binding protein [Ilumatobacteraceae bacterium]
MAIAWWAERFPDRLAIVANDEAHTYEDLNARVNQLVRALRRRGAKPGDGVAALISNRREFAEVIAATQRAGLRFTPINWHLNAEEAAYIVDNCDAVVFVADARFAETAAKAASSADNATIRFSVGGAIAGFETYDEAIAGEDQTDIDEPVLGSTMLYTSGTTGKPKGVYRTETPPTPGTASPIVLFDYSAGNCVHLATGPLYHAAPMYLSLIAPLTAGVGVVMMDKWSPEEMLRLIEKYRVTHTHVVPTMLHRLLALPESVREAADVSSVVGIVHGAAACPVPIKRAIIDWFGPIVGEYYGATEGAGTTVTCEEWLDHPGTVGKPATPELVQIRDENGAEVARGEVGQVYLQAPPVGRFKYYKDDAKTDSTYQGDYFTLGDVGFIDQDGYLYLTDRSANLIISGGVNIYPAESEAELLCHPAVGDVAVIGAPDDEWGELVVAVVELKEDVEPTPELQDELIAFCRDRLAHFKCPRRVDFVDELPRHDNGKLYKKQIRHAYRR